MRSLLGLNASLGSPDPRYRWLEQYIKADTRYLVSKIRLSPLFDRICLAKLYAHLPSTRNTGSCPLLENAYESVSHSERFTHILDPGVSSSNWKHAWSIYKPSLLSSTLKSALGILHVLLLYNKESYLDILHQSFLFFIYFERNKNFDFRLRIIQSSSKRGRLQGRQYQ